LQCVSGEFGLQVREPRYALLLPKRERQGFNVFGVTESLVKISAGQAFFVVEENVVLGGTKGFFQADGAVLPYADQPISKIELAVPLQAAKACAKGPDSSVDHGFAVFILCRPDGLEFLFWDFFPTPYGVG
jgi:hypothetical protein